MAEVTESLEYLSLQLLVISNNCADPHLEEPEAKGDMWLLIRLRFFEGAQAVEVFHFQ